MEVSGATIEWLPSASNEIVGDRAPLEETSAF
jgi:hypothetical protein